jgi:phosphoribosylaminoimidazole-succinocarboxamide synthase
LGVAIALREIEIPGLRRFRRGKVRDTYDLGDRLLMVASDRLSAFDVILPDGVPDKGRVLTQLSAFWFRRTADQVPNHLLSTDIDDLPPEVGESAEALRDRFMIVRKAERIEIECVVRGYVAGSAWVEYQRDGTVCGQRLPSGLVESSQLPEPIFTPASKNDVGHDENISIAEVERRIGAELTSQLIDRSTQLYSTAAAYAAQRGLLIADTKFEFGHANGRLIVIDEILTPDSSRFWEAAAYEPGRPQESFDKQYVRDWLIASGWDRNPPAPPLPAEVIEGTANRYREAYERITGLEWETA